MENSNMKKIFNIENLEQTAALARQIADLSKGKVLTITLDGDLGAGKTTWTKSFGKALGVKNTINSPTFTIMKSYKQADGNPLWHLDAYRLEGLSQDLGFDECFDDGIAVVEWSDYISDQLPADHLSISIENGNDEERVFTIESNGPLSSSILEELK
ncbi:tRNA (adenosine(37)-N6)-threonylcarbamoyltransferase complex ATPase subunit type 1 TsaE [Ileibacterium valens]|uniref:tRNA (adenosine(37)-N6)-threonylcarbamoyltransferase complex ATPase subunit type 1 TsaE n=1 Tax=Ileibacterium valens TaxID=1862668 RepID=UPI003F7410E3